jgi:hypothetical protein
MSSRTNKVSEQKEQMSEQNPIMAKKNLYVISNKTKYSVRANQNNGQNKLSLLTEQIIITRTRYYYSQSKLL